MTLIDIITYHDISGPWVCPADVITIDRQFGIGGGGSGASGINGGNNAGGDSGSSSFSNNFPVTPGDTYNWHIGIGGPPGSNAVPIGTVGGDTWFYGGTEAYPNNNSNALGYGGIAGTTTEAGIGTNQGNGTDDGDPGGCGSRPGSGTTGGGGAGAAGMEDVGRPQASDDLTGTTGGLGGNIGDPGWTPVKAVGGNGGNGGTNGNNGAAGNAPGGGGGGAGTNTNKQGGAGANGRGWNLYRSAFTPAAGYVFIGNISGFVNPVTGLTVTAKLYSYGVATYVGNVLLQNGSKLLLQNGSKMLLQGGGVPAIWAWARGSNQVIQ